MMAYRIVHRGDTVTFPAEIIEPSLRKVGDFDPQKGRVEREKYRGIVIGKDGDVLIVSVTERGGIAYRIHTDEAEVPHV
jgi:hypothetical protein